MDSTNPFAKIEQILSKSAAKPFLDDRQELEILLNSLPPAPPKKGTREHEAYLRILKKVQTLKEEISKKHTSWMDLLQNEEKTSREILEK